MKMRIIAAAVAAALCLSFASCANKGEKEEERSEFTKKNETSADGTASGEKSADSTEEQAEADSSKEDDAASKAEKDSDSSKAEDSSTESESADDSSTSQGSSEQSSESRTSADGIDDNEPAKTIEEAQDDAYRTAAEAAADYLKLMADAFIITRNFSNNPIPDGEYKSGDGSDLSQELEQYANGAEFEVLVENGSVSGLHYWIHDVNGKDYEVKI